MTTSNIGELVLSRQHPVSVSGTLDIVKDGTGLSSVRKLADFLREAGVRPLQASGALDSGFVPMEPFVDSGQVVRLSTDKEEFTITVQVDRMTFDGTLTVAGSNDKRASRLFAYATQVQAALESLQASGKLEAEMPDADPGAVTSAPNPFA